MQRFPKSKKPKVSDVMMAITKFSYQTGELQDSSGVIDEAGIPVPLWKYLQILSAVVLPDDPNESPHDYFDYSGQGGDEFAQALRQGKIYGTPAEFWVKGKERKFLDYLYAKYPKVKHV